MSFYTARRRLYNTATGKHVEPGERTDLSHLAVGDIRRLIQADAIYGETPELPLELMLEGLSSDVAMRLWDAGIREPQDLVSTSPGRVAAFGGVGLELAREFQEQAIEFVEESG